jgi:hypothetical protein
MTCNGATRIVVLCLLLASGIAAQEEQVTRLEQEVRALREALNAQRVDFEQRMGSMQAELQRRDERADAAQLEQAVHGMLPLVAAGPKAGGVRVFGAARARFEARQHVIDFRDGALDDEGTRMNGRVRIGFEGRVAGGGAGPEVRALAEFQAAGRMTGNTIFDQAGPGGTPLPAEYSFFDTPFDRVGLHQGYIDLASLCCEEWSLRAGRQEFTKGSQFALGNHEWQGGLSHDGVSAQYQNKSWTSTLFHFVEAQSMDALLVTQPGDDMDDDTLSGIYIQTHPMVGMDLDVYALYFNGHGSSSLMDRFQTLSTGTAFDGAWIPTLRGQFWTYGVRWQQTGVKLGDGLLALSAEAAWQQGDNALDASLVGADNEEIQGLGAEVLANWWIDPSSELSPILSLGFYNASGGRRNGSSASGWPYARSGYIPLFINRHFLHTDRADTDAPYFAGGGRYGALDLIPLENTRIIKTALSFALTGSSEAGLVWNAAWLADDLGYGDEFFGHELDLFWSWRVNEDVVLSADIGAFFPSEGATATSNWMFFAPGSPEAGSAAALGINLQASVHF